MRKITLITGMFALNLAAFSQTTTQPCPVSFKRSNGAGGGCPIAKLTLIYASCPTEALPIDSVYQSGVKINATFGAGIIDCSGTQPKITYCITSTNIAPVGFLTIYFHSLGAFNGNTCSVPSGGPLPVKLSSFFAKRNNNTVTLNWHTETEINSKEFILERKTGNAYTAIATIATANKSTGSSYSYLDNNSSKGVSQYRLKIVDLDGSFSYSEMRAVKGTSTVSDFTVFPNPSNGNAKITISDISEPTDVQLVDLSGRVLKNISMNNSNSVELNSLQKGMYMIRIVNKNSGESVTQKLSVVN